MTFKARTTFALLSLLIATSATPLNAWWLSDWLFNKPSAPTEVKTQTAATHLIAISAAALLLPISLFGWKLYSMGKKNTELETKKTETEAQNKQLETEKKTLESTLSEKTTAFNKIEKENSTLKTTNADLYQYKTDVIDDTLNNTADNFRRKQALKQLKVNAKPKARKRMKTAQAMADQYRERHLLKDALNKWKYEKEKLVLTKSAVHTVAAQRRAEHLARSPLARAEEQQRQKQIAAITGRNHQHLYPNGNAAQPLPGALAHRRPGINSGQHQQPNADTLIKEQIVAAALGQI
jgi:hypothetical protein